VASSYLDLIKNPAVVRILALSAVVRVPLFAASIVVVLHVVDHLGRTYAEAGVVSAVLAVGLTISGPWRGRRLDQLGLRRAVAPSLLVLAVGWSVAPWVGYWPLVVIVGIAGLFTVPSFSIIRQVMLAAVRPEQRTLALSVDSVVTELCFMVGPVLGVLAASYLPTTVALLLCQLLSVAGAAVIWLVDPPLRHADELLEGIIEQPRRRGVRWPAWAGPRVVVTLACAVTATLVLTSGDLGIVAALREWGHDASIGWMLALWGGGSAVGGLVYGALRHHPPAYVPLLLLSGTTALCALADDRLWFALLLVVSGAFCAPTLTATVDDLTRAVPARVRGEAMGWHGSALTLGGALGAPVLGAAIDGAGWEAAFVLAGVVGLAVAGIGAAYGRLRRHVFVADVTVGTGCDATLPASEAGNPPTS